MILNDLYIPINSNGLNIDFKRREEIIFVNSIIWDETLGGCKFFEDLTLDKLTQLLEEGFAEPQETQNQSPNIQEFYEFGKSLEIWAINPFYRICGFS